MSEIHPFLAFIVGFSVGAIITMIICAALLGD